MCGIQYHCETCSAFDLCYKCYLSKEVIHPSAHPFRLIGPEYLAESEGGESDEDNEEEDEELGEEEED